MSLTIVADENIPAVEHYLGALGQVLRVNGRTLTRSQLIDADILLVRSVTRVDAELLAGSTVRFVGTATSGFDHVDRDYLACNGIGFAHAPGANGNSVVEYVLAAVAAVDDTLEQLMAGGLVGIVGYGNIGKALAARLQALGIGFRVYDPWLDQGTVPCAADLDAVLACDVVSLHAELCTDNPWPSHHLLGRDKLARLRAGTLLINASRGSVVDNAALLAHLAGAHELHTVLDVWEGEPVINPALLERVTLGTAHIAGYSLDGKWLGTRMLRDAVIAYLRNAAVSDGMQPGRDRQGHAPHDHAVANQVDSQDAPQSSSQRIPPLRVPGDQAGAVLARFLLQSRYDIRMDDTLLRQAVAEDGRTKGSGRAFDALRRSYRDRRELAGSVVEGVMPHQADLVRALGCTPVLRGISD